MTTHPRGNFYLKETDKEIIRWFTEYHYLQPLHVQLLSRRHIIAVRRRLRQLHDQGFVVRTTVPFARNAPIWSPPDQYVYYLSRKGLTLAQELGFADDQARYNPEKSEALLPHDLFLTTFHLTLRLATAAAGDIHLIYWEQRRAVLQDSVRASYERYSVNPDAVFFLKDDGKPQDQNTSYFFLEYERSRPSGHAQGESNFIRKMRGFYEYHRTAGDAKRWGIPNFYVVTVTPTRERALNLCQATQERELPFKRFWFTDASHVSVERPAEILEKIFFTPKDYAQGVFYSLRT
jgi:hypothetical protein